MTSKTTNKFSPEVWTRAVRMVLDHASEHPSRWAAVTSIAAKIGCTPQTLHDWVKKAEVDSGQRTGVSTDTAEKLKALERENRELRQANAARVRLVSRQRRCRLAACSVGAEVDDASHWIHQWHIAAGIWPLRRGISPWACRSRIR